MQATSKWMMRGISNTDLIGWLKSVKQTAPEFVYNNLMDIAEDEISELRFDIIQNALEAEAIA